MDFMTHDLAEARATEAEDLGLDFEDYDEWEDYLSDWLGIYGHRKLELAITLIAQNYDVDESLLWSYAEMMSRVAAECDAEARHERSQLYGSRY